MFTNCSCLKQNNVIEQPNSVQIVNADDDENYDENESNNVINDNDDDLIFRTLYNKITLVSLEFSKAKKTIKELTIKNDLLYNELIDLKKQQANKESIKNIEYINPISTNDNTIIFMSISNLTSTKIKLIFNLYKNKKYNIVFGLDEKYISDYQTLQNTNTNNEIIILNNDELIQKYTNKINNFNGKWMSNPSKLGAYNWFNSSNYEYMWYIEDDVYAKDWDNFFSNYENKTDDVVYKFTNELPFWYYNNWRVGSKKHAIHLAHLYVHRVSKTFIDCLIKSIIEEKDTSHHELYIPYIISKYQFTSLKLNDDDTKFSKPNKEDENSGFSKEFIENNESNLFHPVKLL